jgi:hypothetical protein
MVGRYAYLRGGCAQQLHIANRSHDPRGSAKIAERGRPCSTHVSARSMNSLWDYLAICAMVIGGGITTLLVARAEAKWAMV